MIRCRHVKCLKDTKGKVRARGLCSTCYANPEIKALYPPNFEHRPDLVPEKTSDTMTMAELDELEERMRPSMPDTTLD